MIDTHILIEQRSDCPRVDSRLMAQHLGNQHRSAFKLISDYQADFEALGKVRFEITPSPNSATGQKERHALLNEDQAYLLLAFSRNTDKVRALKVKLVQAFAEARKAAALRQSEYLPSYHALHGALSSVAVDAQHQRHLHINTNRLLNKTAGIDAGGRSSASVGSQALLIAGQMLAVSALTGAADHKDAYCRIKRAVAPLQALAITGAA